MKRASFIATFLVASNLGAAASAYTRSIQTGRPPVSTSERAYAVKMYIKHADEVHNVNPHLAAGFLVASYPFCGPGQEAARLVYDLRH
jgi:hypothetical protein